MAQYGNIQQRKTHQKQVEIVASSNYANHHRLVV